MNFVFATISQAGVRDAETKPKHKSNMKTQCPSNQVSELQSGFSSFHQITTSTHACESAAFRRQPAIRKEALLVALGACLLFAFRPVGLASPYVTLNGAQPRPFYVIAHNPNTLDEAEEALKNGCNTLEPDITEITCGGQEVLVDFDSDFGVPDCGETSSLLKNPGFWNLRARSAEANFRGTSKAGRAIEPLHHR
jgi:hypothetical protein